MIIETIAGRFPLPPNPSRQGRGSQFLPPPRGRLLPSSSPWRGEVRWGLLLVPSMVSFEAYLSPALTRRSCPVPHPRSPRRLGA